MTACTDEKCTVNRYDDAESQRKDERKEETHKESKAKPKNPGPKVASTQEPKTILRALTVGSQDIKSLTVPS